MTKVIRIATRPSLLATTQTNWVVDRLKNNFPEYIFEVITFSTQGDIDTNSKLTSFGTTGLFVKELENALYKNEADIAVHSLKDVPSSIPDGLNLVSFPEREIPNDILITKNNISIENLPNNSVIGTGSPRRVLQLKLLRDDFQFKEIRGNIDTRLHKLNEGLFDAIVLAAAGMNRLNKPYSIHSILDINDMIPAIGQGILALECRSNDSEIIKIAKSINHEASMHAALAERIFMKTVEGGCKFPLAAYAKVINHSISLQALIGDLNTNKYIKHGIVCHIDEYPDLIYKFAIEMKILAKQDKIQFNHHN